MEKYVKELQENGYTVIPDILSKSEVEEALKLFKNWQSTIPNHNYIHKRTSPHGIYKFHEVGHQEHAWFIRTRPKVKEIFASIWKTDNLVVSFDGSCWIPKDFKGKDTFWCHSDQAPKDKEFKCVQGVIGLTDNKERTLVVWEKTHIIHYEYFKSIGREGDSKAWQKIPDIHEEKLKPLRKVLHIPSGAIALWDSRLFHQNQYGAENSEERIVQYICMLPREHHLNNSNMSKKRLKYFEERRTTSHWPYPIKVNSLQPQNWGDSNLIINYSDLNKPNLDRFMNEIKSLI